MSSNNQALSKLKLCGKKTWVKMGDLELNKPYRITEVKRCPSKFDKSKMQTIVHLENGFTVTLSTRFDDLNEEMFTCLQTAGVNLINRGPSGKSWIIDFEEINNPQEIESQLK